MVRGANQEDDAITKTAEENYMARRIPTIFMLRLSFTTFFDPSRSMEEVNTLLSTERYLNHNRCE